MAILDLLSLENKVAVVTGGGGTLGKQLVQALAEAGATTILASRTLASIEEVAASQRTLGHDVVAMDYDQSDESSVLALRDKVMQRYGKIDILVNNAVARPMKGGYHDDASAFNESMQINATGLFVITRAFGDIMAEQGSGSIINIGSIQGMVGPDPMVYRDSGNHGWYPDYFFHKGGVLNFTRFVASYYGSSAVRCNCISPGGIALNQPEAFVRQYSERTCLNRLANDTDFQGIIVLLASDASMYITGANIPVDGGYTAK
jgi:NAD(P)-dependent dehydrogenase (short-subunit alcohol dehydrogenase family)